MSNVAQAAADAAQKAAQQSISAAVAQTAAQSSNFADPAIETALEVLQMIDAKQIQAQAAQLQDQVNKAKNQVAEAAAKAAAKSEIKLQENVSEMTVKLTPTKIPMNLTESLTTKIGKVVAGVNVSELTQEIKGGKFVKTAYLGRAVDAVGVQDIYGIKDNSVINKAPSGDMTVFAVEMMKILRSQSKLLEEVKSITKSPTGSFDLSPDAMAERVKCALGNSSAALNNLGASLKSNVTSGVNTSTAALMDQFMVTLNGVTSKCTAGSVNDARGLLDAVNRLTGDPQMAKIFDVGVEAHLLSGLFEEAIAIGMPDAMTVLADASTSDRALQQACANVLNSALRSGNTNTVSAITDLMGSNQILAMAPDAVQLILSNYKIKSFTPEYGLMIQLNQLKSLLDSIDANWRQVDRNGEQIINLTLMLNMSQDARDLLAYDPDLSHAARLTDVYAPETVQKSIKDKYPLCPDMA